MAQFASWRTPRSGDMNRICPDPNLRCAAPMLEVMDESFLPTNRGASDRIAVQSTLNPLSENKGGHVLINQSHSFPWPFVNDQPVPTRPASV